MNLVDPNLELMNLVGPRLLAVLALVELVEIAEGVREHHDHLWTNLN